MTTSVVLSTYNGERYIFDLLETLLHQTLVIDEVLICDDCSSDQTVDIIKRFIYTNKLSNWKLEVNKNNLGWKQNFYNLITAAQGDLIFPCDQDDIWHLDKVEKCQEAICAHKGILLLCSDYNVFYMDGATVFPKTKVSKIKDNNEVEKIQSMRAVQIVDRPGCTYCIRKELVPIMRKIWFNDCPHDALAWRAAVLCNGLYIYHKKLIDFRRHSSNSSDKKRNSLQERIDLAEYYVTTFTRLLSYSEIRKRSDMNKYLNKSLDYQKRRKKYLETKSISDWLMNLGCVFYIPSIKTYIADGIAILKFREGS